MNNIEKIPARKEKAKYVTWSLREKKYFATMLKANVGLQTIREEHLRIFKTCLTRQKLHQLRKNMNKYIENNSSTKYRSQTKKNPDLQKFEDEVCKIVLEKSCQKKGTKFSYPMVTETCIMVRDEEPYSKMDCLTNMKFTAKYIKRLMRDQNLKFSKT